MFDANPDYPSIPEFFEDQEIFITGGTGFMGKALIEKILRSCPKVKIIYALIRSKKNKTADERLAVLKTSSVFDRLRRENPQLIDKLVAVDGDVMELALGLSAGARQRMENVTMIFHVAASVRFDDPLKKAILMNTRGTREVMRLGESLKNLRFCMHVSTTYCNPTHSVIEEKLYTPPGDWKVAIKLAETMDDYTLDVLTEKFTKFHPNTYTYTKALAEQVVNEYRDRIPVIIFRPSIVISAIEEPEPGWLDNFNGPVGLLLACGIGILRTCYADPEQISDYLPCDIAIKAMLITAWKHGLENRSHEPSDSIEIYNCCTSNVRQMKMGEMIELGRELSKEVPFNKILWAPGGSITKSRFLNYIRFLLYQFLPSIFLDIGLRLSGNKYFLLKLQRRIYIANMALQYFILNQWEFKNDKFMTLSDEVKLIDYETFAFRQYANHDVRMYFKSCAHGARKYLLHEKDEDLPKARKQFMRMYYLDKLAGLEWLLQLSELEQSQRSIGDIRQSNQLVDCFELPDKRFKKLFRVNMQIAEEVVETLYPHMITSSWVSALSVETKIMCALTYFATGSYQQDIGNHKNASLSQPSISRSLHEVIDAVHSSRLFASKIKLLQRNAKIFKFKFK